MDTNIDKGKGKDNVGVGAQIPLGDLARAHKVWTIRKYANDKAFQNDEAYEEVQFEGNVLLEEGIAAFQNLLIGAAETAFNNANSTLGVGDSTTAESAAHTGLQAATNKAFVGMETGYPQINAQATTWRAVFDGNTANFDWNEFCVNNGADDTADTLNRKVSSQGTKASGQTWTLDLTITWS